MANRGYSAVAENSSMRVWRASRGINAVLVHLFMHTFTTVLAHFYVSCIIFPRFLLACNAFIKANNVITIYHHFCDKIASFEKKIYKSHKILEQIYICNRFTDNSAGLSLMKELMNLIKSISGAETRNEP